MAERRNKTIRDMVITMSVLLVAVLAFVGLYGSFSFAPGGPTEGETPTADVVTGFQRAGENLPFPPAVPEQIPADWHPNSFSVTRPENLANGALPTVRGGWLTPEGTFVTLIEAEGTAGQVLEAEIGSAAAPTGTVDAGGRSWTVVPGRRAEIAWYCEVPGVGDRTVSYLITGSASRSAFQVLAESIS